MIGAAGYNGIGVGTTTYWGIQGSVDPTTVEGNALTIAPFAMTIRNLRVKRVNNAPGTGISHTTTLRVNQVATALSVVISGAVDTSGSDLVNVVSVALGDSVTVSSLIGAGGNNTRVIWTAEARRT